MGSSALGLRLSSLGAVLALAAFLSPSPALGQVPAAEPSPNPSASPPPAPASAAPAPSAPAAPAPPPAAPAPPPAATAPRAEPPPLDPPPAATPASPPAFLHPRQQPLSEPRATPSAPVSEEDFLKQSSPWVDFTLTSFYLDARVGNFLNLGAQLGMYAFDRLRLSARFATPLSEVDDGMVSSSSSPFFPGGGGATTTRVASRSMSMLYGGSVGLVVTNSKSFVFGPSLSFLRTDVEDYGTAFAVSMPFEWTTRRSLRVGFELGLGHAFGGSVRTVCRSGIVSCGTAREDRPSGTAVLFQFNMGWALGRL